MEETLNIGDLFQRSEFKNQFVRFSYDKDLQSVVEKNYKIVDGKEEIFDFKFVVSCNLHQILFTSFLSFSDISTARISLEEVCNRADTHNKLVVGYHGKNSLNEKYYIVQCKICGYVAKQYMRHFYSCNGCNPTSLKSLEDFISKSIIVHEDKYNYSDVEYNGIMKKVKIFCRKCKKYFFQTANDHLRGHGCPKCNESKGEMRVAKYLSEKNISFIPQKTFESLRYLKPLKCDFYISEINGLVEYDGHGHYRPCFGSTPEEKQKNLEDTQRRDQIKNEWARKNNIPLLRIPYLDFHRIEELIEAFILEHRKLVAEI